ncbi:MAG: tetratricopeptide repeat protein [Proteobacteria bacterium]|nr:tetratricopeptide repeat protein [Pseudomonadota bacterium]
MKGISGIKEILTTDAFYGLLGNKKIGLEGGRYRPLSFIIFAIIYDVFGSYAPIYHYINILLYALTCFLIYVFTQKIIPVRPITRWYFSIPWITAIFFLVHPIHTEVVNNIKGLDEILAFFLSLLTVYLSLLFVENQKFILGFFIGFIFLLALMAKENAITFLSIIPLTQYLFSNDRKKSYILTLFPLLTATGIYFFLRIHAIGSIFSNQEMFSLMNNPFLEMTCSQKYATICYILGLYLKLLLFPHPLTYDYYPYHIPIISWQDIRAIVPFLIHVSGAIFALAAIRRYKIFSYGILFYLMTLSIVSNVIFTVGTFMNERFIYFSSYGVCLIVSYFICHISACFSLKGNKMEVRSILLIIIVTFFSIKTIYRNTFWKDDFTLLSHDINISSESAKGNFNLAFLLYHRAIHSSNIETRQNELSLAIDYLTKAIHIYPGYQIAHFSMGLAYYQLDNNIVKLLDQFKQATSLSRDPDFFVNELLLFTKDIKNPDHKIAVLEGMDSILPDKYGINYNLGLSYGQYKRDYSTAIIYFSRAIHLKPDFFDAYLNLGVAYQFNQDYLQAVNIFEKALELHTDDIRLIRNLGFLYLKMNMPDKANAYLEIARQKEKNLEKRF